MPADGAGSPGRAPARPARRAAAEILPAGFVGTGRADVLLTAFGVLQIEPAGQRTVGRRLEVGGAAQRRIDEEAAFGARVRSGHGIGRPLSSKPVFQFW